MIRLCKNDREFFNICDKLKEIKGVKLTENILYNYMTAGLFNKRIFTFVSHDDEKMNGCLVLLLVKDIFGELTLSMIFTWIDAHYPKIHKEFIDISIKKARELGAKKIGFTTNRNEKVINRRVGKYGFNKVCSLYEKRTEGKVI